MKKLLLVDPLGAANGMRRWHENFHLLASKVFAVRMLSNYHSGITTKAFSYDKTKKIGSVASIAKLAGSAPSQPADLVWLAHYGESLNTLLFLPALLRFSRRKRYLMIHDAVSTLRSERPGLRNRLTRFADKCLLAAFDKLIVHNKNLVGRFPGKEVLYLPLPPREAGGETLASPPTHRYLFWGFLKRSKNVEFILQLAATMPDRIFDVYGSFINSEYKKEFLAGIEAVKAPNVNFVERFLDEETVGDLLRGYDAVLLPYTFITNSGILQTNADHGVISVTSDLPNFAACSDISVNLKLDTEVWKQYLQGLNENRIRKERKRLYVANRERLNDFLTRLQRLAQ